MVGLGAADDWYRGRIEALLRRCFSSDVANEIISPAARSGLATSNTLMIMGVEDRLVRTPRDCVGAFYRLAYLGEFQTSW